MSERLDLPELWAVMAQQGHQWPHPIWRGACYELNARDMETQLAVALEQNRPVHAIRVLVDLIGAERLKAAECIVEWSESQEVRRAA